MRKATQQRIVICTIIFCPAHARFQTSWHDAAGGEHAADYRETFRSLRCVTGDIENWTDWEPIRIDAVDKRYKRTATLLILYALSGTVLGSGPPQNNNAINQKISQSWLFKNMRIFYEEDAHNVKQRKLTHSDFLQLQGDLNKAMQGVLTIHNQSVDELSKYLGDEMKANPMAAVSLLDLQQPNESAPYAGSSIDPKTHDLRVYINAALLRTLFQSAVIAAARKQNPPEGPYIEQVNKQEAIPDDQKSSDCTDDECIQRFLAFASLVNHGRLPIGSEIYAMLATNQVDTTYSGAIFFILAHELGHYVLGHHSHSCDAPACRVFEEDELKADRYAAYLRTLYLGLNNFGALLFDQYTGISNIIGFPHFFEQAYPRLSFGQSLCACEYPDEELREKNANEVAVDAAKRVPEIQKTAAEGSLSERTEAIKAKYKNLPRIKDASTLNQVTDSSPLLLPVLVGEKVGYMDTSGAIVIGPEFEGGNFFSEGLARVTFPSSQKRINRGFIDQKGEVRFRVNKRYTRVDDFKEGRALVGVQIGSDDKYGFIDQSGNLVIDTDFDRAADFSENLAVVRVSNPIDLRANAYGFIDRDGRFAIEPKYKSARSFSEGFAAIQDRKTEKWGYIDKSAHVVITPQFDLAWDFHESLALVEIDGKRQFIDRSGTTIASVGFSTAYDFSEGLALANLGGKSDSASPDNRYVNGGKWSFIDHSGATPISQTYDCAHPFNDGLAAVNVGGKTAEGYCIYGKWGFIGKDGSLVIPPKFNDVIDDFKGGVALVESAGKRLYIDKSGSVISSHNK